MAARKVTLKIAKCGDCPHHDVGMGYSLDGWDHGNDWKCKLTGKVIASFVERPSEEPKTIPKSCPLLK